MPAPALVIQLAPRIAAQFVRLFGGQYARSRSRRAIQGTFVNNYRVSLPSERLARRHTRHDWQRTIVPVYGSPYLTIPAVSVIVPAGLSFPWSNPHAIPAETPQFSLRETRNQTKYLQANIPVPQLEFITRTPPQRAGGRTYGPPPERHRRRQDTKSTYGFNRIQQFRHRLYDSPSELLEFWHAISRNPTLFGTATALAANEAVDYAYGGRARLLRDQVYRTEHWRLPVGIDTINSLIHGRTTF